MAYVVPTAVGRCKQFHASLQTDPDAPPPAGSSPLAQLRGWLAAAKPTWMQHMFSHVLIDADIAIQACVDANRCGVGGHCAWRCVARVLLCCWRGMLHIRHSQTLFA